MQSKTVEEIYQKKTPLQHILLRPDTYIGTIEPTRQTKWVLPSGQTRFECKEITYTPGFYKIFDEVLVNAADNYQRDKKMSKLTVIINQKEGFITVTNNGKGIPVVVHKEHKIFVPELIFGHLLTGSNYNDDQRRVVGGRNGYGAKLANVFSDKFVLQCGDGQNGKKFKMEWKKNMSIHGQPVISSYSGRDFVSVTFYPCFRKLNMENGLDEDIMSLLSKRVYDMAGIMPKVKVSLNGEQIDIRSFSQYVDLYFDRDSKPTKIMDSEVNSARWQVIVSVSEGEFRQVSFVNSVCTSKGGTHINYLLDQITERVQEKIKKKEKSINIKPFQIKAHIWIFVNCLIENPTFDTQTKETLTLKASKFGSKCELSESMIKEFLKLGIVDLVINLAKQKEMSKLAKTTAGTKKTKLLGIPKLQDANEAGSRNSEKCTLILTEGDSAKSLAVAGLTVIGRDHYGVFPLKGKLLNVREANSKTLGKNEEIQNLLKIIGLNIGKKYEDLKSLRYGAIMIMSDQDTDGSHIKGLIINFIHHFWPNLFKMDGFLKQFITPLLKASKGNQTVSFYTMSDYKVWTQSIENLKSWNIKYYKGLGTSTDKEAREYFENLRKNKIDFKYVDAHDDESIELVFSKKKADERKTWLSTYDPDVVMAYDQPKVRYKEFVDRELIHFSNEDNNRSIASLVDGLKPGQRKILFGCFKRNLTKEMKVAQLAGYIAEKSAYHHGEVSLVETIVGMAQNFVGSNNIHLLMPNGQFGSRNAGGKDHASGRYIFTNLSPVTRYLFPEPDDHTLTYVIDDGQVVEPEYYIPILPLILINGCQGIGTGWSTHIFNFNPRELAEIMKKKLMDPSYEFPSIDPWYKNYSGRIAPSNEQRTKYEVSGRLTVSEDKENTVIINELPVGKWTKDYKAALDEIMTEGDTEILGLKEYHTKDTVHFEVEMNENFLNKIYSDDEDYERLYKYFKLCGSMSLNNMVGFNSQKRLAKMSGVRQILNEFYELRLSYYDKRKEYLKSRLVCDLVMLQEKERFIIEVVEEKIMIRNVKRVKLCQTLKERKFIRFSDMPKVKSTKITAKGPKANKEEGLDGSGSDSDAESQRGDETKEYKHLLSMPIYSLTFEKVEQIREKRKNKQSELGCLEKLRIEDMWIEDIDSFLAMLEKVEQKEAIEKKKEDELIKKNLGKNKGQKAVRKKVAKDVKKKGEKGAYNWDSDDSVETKQTKGVEKTEKAKPKVKGQKRPAKEKKSKKENKSKSEVSSSAAESSDDDFLSRIKKKIENGKQSYLALKEVDSQGINFNKEHRQYKLEEVVSKKKTRNKPRKKMALDSDEESDGNEEEYSEHNLSDGSDYSI